MAPDVDDEEGFDPEESERQVSEFIATADEIPGPSAAETAASVLAVVERAWQETTALLADQPNNKILATMLALSRQARETDPHTDRYWCLSAASTIVSGQIPNAV